MTAATFQERTWRENFGRNYTSRNPHSLEEMENLCQRQLGISRTRMNQEFLNGLNRSMCILEVGSNIGNQLVCLKRMGFANLYGIEINDHAIDCLKQQSFGVKTLQASVLNIPFQDESFDLVFTSCLLIHIAPSDIERAMGEIYRCTRYYIWGYEYFAKDYTEIIYRGQKNLLWKADFAQLYCNLFDLKLMKRRRFSYAMNDNIDEMFLLQKVGRCEE